ncbi:MAG: sigma-70 family RNA polymerase sigma factor [Cyclobacteriaceae bacterium]|nr:sigma-70 family RNA polymerase sigma factor [Cyclobacteriaceae bacterium]
MLSDEELVRHCLSGERAAQKQLYDRFCRKMMAISLRYASTSAEAEDIVMEGFMSVFNNLKQFQFKSRLETWITRIMINAALNKQRRKMYLMPVVDVQDVVIGEEESVSLSGFHYNELLKIIQSLPDGCRIIFNLFAIEGYSHNEISEMLGVSVGTSKSQYNRARKLLMERLAKETTTYERLGERQI